MLRPKKKISKKELKEDALISTYVKATGWYEANKKTIGIAALALAVVIVAVVGYLNNRRANNEKAATEFAKIYTYYDQGQYQIAIDGVPERNITGLKAIVDNYGSSAAGEIARFYLANSCFQLRRYDEALEHFEAFSPSDPMMTVARLTGIAACQEAQGKFDDAASSFEKAATKYSGDVSAAENLGLAARNYARAGNKERALELCRKIKKEYPKSATARDVDRYITEYSL